MGSITGIDKLFGLGLQSAIGTADTLGSNDKLLIQTVDGVIHDDSEFYAEGKKFPAHLRKIRNSKDVTIVIPWLEAQGIHELFWLAMIGTLTSAPAQRSGVADGRVAYDEQFTLAAQPGYYLTLAGTSDADKTNIFEWEGFKPKRMVLEVSDSDVMCTVEGFCNAARDNTTGTPTNTSTELAALTFRTTFQTNTGALNYKSLMDRLWVAIQSDATFSSADKVCASMVRLTLEWGYEDIVNTTCSDAYERKIVTPSTILWEITLNDWTDLTWWNRYYNNVRVKVKADFHDDYGSPGVSISDSSPSTDITGSATNKFNVTLRRDYADGTYQSDGPHELSIGSAGLNSGAAIAAAIQAQLRLVTATNTEFQEAFTTAVCDYNSTNAGKYTLRPTTTINKRYRFVVTNATSNNCADELKIGVANGGTESAGIPNSVCIYTPDCVVLSPDPLSLPEEGRVNYTLKLQASDNYSSAINGFQTSDDARLLTDMSAEAMRVVITKTINSTAPTSY